MFYNVILKMFSCLLSVEYLSWASRPMAFNPGVLRSPYNDGAIIVYENTVLHLKSKNGAYWYQQYPVTPVVATIDYVTILVPDWLTSC